MLTPEVGPDLPVVWTWPLVWPTFGPYSDGRVTGHRDLFVSNGILLELFVLLACSVPIVVTRGPQMFVAPSSHRKDWFDGGCFFNLSYHPSSLDKIP